MEENKRVPDIRIWSDTNGPYEADRINMQRLAANLDKVEEILKGQWRHRRRPSCLPEVVGQ